MQFADFKKDIREFERAQIKEVKEIILELKLKVGRTWLLKKF